ncbi:gamma-glutamyl-gamma-aminobutyrate hydrolase family protein [Carboxylicivirga sp. N1Y90]|uniref:gamma-glutamyl-gamma-aminobutyrate hydrolase family protein n=1 Tax=Carboxylicivirga fragile TaxID=3417571 RepID=UPI003D355CDA|nr:gamma-glutamyl-gamma-aminobutyrate hydrolase family protein [Marinilabiliaceae bacterium N1Y90]
MHYITIFLLFLGITVSAQLPNDTAVNNIDKRLLIMHPTQSTIEVIVTLHEKELLDLGSSEVFGVYHKDEKYDYAQSHRIIDTLSSINMKIVAIADTLYEDSLYCQNACSQTFMKLFTESNGAIFFGGPDIPPTIYGEEAHSRTIVSDPYRHYFEASFLYHLLGGYQNNEYTPLIAQKPDYFINGICLGMQTMNIATGGTLIQDIPDEIYNSDEKKGLKHLEKNEIHRNYYRHTHPHLKRKLSGSYFHSISFVDFFFPDLLEITSDTAPMVNSYHHQAVETLGKGFKVSATSEDKKIIEAMFHVHYPNVFAVQFHPERVGLYKSDNKYQFTPKGKQKYLYEWIDEESMDFHIKYWQAINIIWNQKL